MAHVLARLNGVKAEDLQKALKADAPEHAKQDLHLEHLWKHADDSTDVMFLFRSDHLAQARQFIQKAHTQALEENPNAKLPQMTFLEEK